MKDYINTSIASLNEAAGLFIAICDQLGIPCNGKHDAGNMTFMRDTINAIAGKYKINVSVSNQLLDYGISLNQIANDLVLRNILDEGVLLSKIREFLSQNPSVRR
ncbi:MAG: hypothetical protein LUF01_14330 [Bacteroides sp.]|nr:hypothetical protein [Bacteroides sp.]